MPELGEHGGADVTLGGAGLLPGKRRRKPRSAEAIAARVAKFKDNYKPKQEYDKRGKHIGGTMPLNAGFFRLERMRSQGVTKARAKQRAKVKGK